MVLSRRLRVPISAVLGWSLAACSSARLDPLEFNHYSSRGDSAPDEIAGTYPIADAASSPISSAQHELPGEGGIGFEPTRRELEPVVPLVEQDSRVITMQKGDNLYSLSLRHLGDGKRWPEIARLNGLSETDVKRLAVGRQLKLPAR